MVSDNTKPKTMVRYRGTYGQPTHVSSPFIGCQSNIILKMSQLTRKQREYIRNFHDWCRIDYINLKIWFDFETSAKDDKYWFGTFI